MDDTSSLTRSLTDLPTLPQYFHLFSTLNAETLCHSFLQLKTFIPDLLHEIVKRLLFLLKGENLSTSLTKSLRNSNFYSMS